MLMPRQKVPDQDNNQQWQQHHPSHKMTEKEDLASNFPFSLSSSIRGTNDHCRRHNYYYHTHSAYSTALRRALETPASNFFINNTPIQIQFHQIDTQKS